MVDPPRGSARRVSDRFLPELDRLYGRVPDNTNTYPDRMI